MTRVLQYYKERTLYFEYFILSFKNHPKTHIHIYSRDKTPLEMTQPSLSALKHSHNPIWSLACKIQFRISPSPTRTEHTQLNTYSHSRGSLTCTFSVGEIALSTFSRLESGPGPALGSGLGSASGSGSGSGSGLYLSLVSYFKIVLRSLHRQSNHHLCGSQCKR